MNLNTNSLWEIIQNAFSKEVWAIVFPAIWDTLYMVSLTTIFTLIIGMLLGIVLVLTDKDGLHPIPWLNKILGGIINVLRSLPSMILIILLLPFARFVLGKGYGPDACIFALVASCVPMFGRLVESSLLEVSKGKIEAAKAMGTSTFRIVTRVFLPETLPSLIRAFTVAIIAVLSISALAGSFGAGGLGDVAVRFGFTRFKTDILIATVLVLVVIVEIVQILGDKLSKLLLKKWNLL